MSETLRAYTKANPLSPVERVTLVGGPCDGQRMFAVPGATVVLYVGLMRTTLDGGRRRRGFMSWMDDEYMPMTYGQQGHTQDAVQLAVYSPRNADGLWVPMLGFDGIQSVPAIPGDGPFPPNTITHVEDDEL